MSPLILIAEDDLTNREAVCRLLAHHGYRTLEARTGDEAISRAQEHHPDLILMDLAMPGMNGIDATQRLKRDPETAAIPVVAVTASWLAEAAQLLEQAGFAAALAKPYPPAALLAQLTLLLAPPAALG